MNESITEHVRWAAAWQQAYDWLCDRRRHYPANADVWHVRFHWAREGPQLYRRVMAGRYRLPPMEKIVTSQGPRVMWPADAALVLKWVTLCVTPWLPRHPACRHLKGHGGYMASRRRALEAILPGRVHFFYRTDIRGYYHHFPKARLAAWIRARVPGTPWGDLIARYIDYSVEWGGEFFTPTTGIARGCALSPLLGGSYLTHVDEALSAHPGVLYERYMDDFLLLSAKRWPLKRAVSQLNGFFAEEGFTRHPDKTQLGRLNRGFTWLGLHLPPTSL